MRAVSPMAFVLAVSLLPIVEAQARVDMFARLRNLKSKGFNPDSIVDVGANQGDWTTRTSRIWPKARMFMVEGTPDKEARLKSIGHPFEITLLGDATKTVPMNIDNRQGTGGTGNGIFRESAAPAGGFRLVDRKMTTLDELLASRGHPAPQLLKLDVQGAELLVLQGARRTLESVEAILVEMSIVEWNVGAPFFFEVHAALEQLGYQAYDLVELRYGGIGSQLQQLDFVFVKKGMGEPDEEALKAVFDSFDDDGSGAVSTSELAAMVESLGMIISTSELEAMIKEADEDESGEIEFGEFLQIIKKAMKDGGNKKGGFASLISRKQNSGPPMKWRGDKAGPGCTVTHEGMVVSKTGGGWGAQLLDQWLSSASFDAASILLECTSIDEAGEGIFIGVVGSNFNPTDWDERFDQNMHCTGAVIGLCPDGLK